MTSKYLTSKETFYNSTEGDPQNGFDIYFNNNTGIQSWCSLGDKYMYQYMQVFVGDPVRNDWSYQIVYFDPEYDMGDYWSDRGF
jgi:hypothetical protein